MSARRWVFALLFTEAVVLIYLTIVFYFVVPEANRDYIIQRTFLWGFRIIGNTFVMWGLAETIVWLTSKFSENVRETRLEGYGHGGITRSGSSHSCSNCGGDCGN